MMIQQIQKADHLQERQLSSEEIFQGRVVHLTRDTVLLENGEQTVREVIHHPGGAGVVPLTDDGDIILVRQFRYPHGIATLEIPAGKLEYGEDPADCARRELKEEAGAEPGRFESLGSMIPTPAYDKEVTYLFLARDLKLDDQQHLDEDEFLDVVRMPLAEAVEQAMTGGFPDGKTQLAILKTAFLLEREKKQKD